MPKPDNDLDGMVSSPPSTPNKSRPTCPFFAPNGAWLYVMMATVVSPMGNDTQSSQPATSLRLRFSLHAQPALVMDACRPIRTSCLLSDKPAATACFADRSGKGRLRGTSDTTFDQRPDYE